MKYINRFRVAAAAIGAACRQGNRYAGDVANFQSRRFGSSIPSRRHFAILLAQR
ncbi:MAG: hypothetical protein ABI557_16270 [Aureliella sp.]